MREALEQTAWSMRTLIQQQYDTRKNSTLFRKVVIFVVLPILTSYIIAHSNHHHHQHNSSDVKMSIAAYIWLMTIGGLSSFLLNIWQALLRIVGITLGIGLGLGLAGHVYDVLSDAQLDTSAGVGGGGNRDGIIGEDNYNRRTTKTNTTQTSSNSKPNLKEHNTSLLMEDANSYHSLMRSAGYTVDNGMMRAQMVRGEQAVDVRSANDAKRSLLLQKKMEQDGMLKSTVDDAIEPQQQQSRVSIYKFDKGTNASTQMRRMWPNLSPLINDSLAKLTEFVLRDYVSSWYSKVDEHVVYTDPSIGVVDGTATAVTAALGAVGVEEKELTMSSVSREGSNNRPSTAPPESMAKRRQMSVTSTTSSSEVGTVGSITTAATTTNSSKGGGLARSDLPTTTTTTTSTIRPRTSNSMELQSSLTSLSSSTAAAAAADPRIFQSPYAVHSPSNSQNTNQQQPQQQRTMVLTTTGTQSSPFIESLYTAFAYLLGMMATRSSENVNILELLLLHFPHILAQNLRVYREMKQVALEKKRRRIVVEREKWRRGQ